jgi:hypothetical protein
VNIDTKAEIMSGNHQNDAFQRFIGNICPMHKLPHSTVPHCDQYFHDDDDNETPMTEISFLPNRVKVLEFEILILNREFTTWYSPVLQISQK